MATKHFRHPARTPVKAVWSGAIDSTTNGHTFVVTLTDDNGVTAAVQVAADGVLTEAQLAAAFAQAWNVSLNPLIRTVVASADAETVTLTARTAGVPFAAVASGTGDWADDGYTTANVGNEDYGTAANWSGDSLPSGGDDVVLPSGLVHVRYGLNQSAVAIGAFAVEPNCRSQFGRVESGLLHYLRIDPDSFSYRGSGQLAAFDVGSANIPLYVEAYGSPQGAGLQNVYLKGHNISILEVVRGTVGVAVLEGEAATIGTVLCGYVQNPHSDVNLTVGSGVTLTTLTQAGGRCLLRCAATTVSVAADAELMTEGSGAITTLTVFGTAYPKSSGTIGTLHARGWVDFSRDLSPRTVTNLVLHDGAHVRLHGGIAVTGITGLAAPGRAVLEYV